MRDLNRELETVKKYGDDWCYVPIRKAALVEFLDRAIAAEAALASTKYKLDMLAEQYKQLEHDNKILRIALQAANVDDETRYLYDPQEGAEQLNSLCHGVIVHIPVEWLLEIKDEAEAALAEKTAENKKLLAILEELQVNDCLDRGR